MLKFPLLFPEDWFPGDKGGTVARLKKDVYGSKSAAKFWYNCLYQFVIELGFTSVAGHPGLFIRVTIDGGRVATRVCVIVICR